MTIRLRHDLAPKLDARNAEVKANFDEIQNAIKKILTGNGAAWGDAMGLEMANTGIMTALGVVESGNRAAPSQTMTVFEDADRAMKLRVDEWNQVKTNRLPQLNQQLNQAHQPTVAIGEIEREVEYLMTR